MRTKDGAVTKYVYGLGLIGEESGGEFKTYHFDYRGSTVAVTGGMGDVTNTFTYDAYGRLTEKVGIDDIIFCYNGKYGVITEPNGLVYMRARYYSPELRRFINADVVAGEISNAITLNRYAYANGNPISNVDPLGLTAERGGLTISWEFDPSYADYLGWGNDLYNIGVEAYDYARYGFYITKGKKGAIVHGAFTKASSRRGIYGAQYSFKNAAKNPNVFSHIVPKTAVKSALDPNSVSGFLGYVFVAIDVGEGIYENVQAGTRPQKIVSDAIVDAGIGVGSIALGAAIGSLIPIPIVGTVLGAGAGYLLEVDFIDGKSIADWVKEGAGYVADAVVDAGEAVVDFVEDAADWVVDTAEEVWDATTDAVEDAVDWIADTASDAWDLVTGWFS